MNCELMLTYDNPAYMFNVYKNQSSRQTGSRNLMGPKMLTTTWGTYMKLVTKYQIPVINSCWEKCFPQNGVPIWSLWRNSRFLPSIFAEKNAMKNVHKNQLVCPNRGSNPPSTALEANTLTITPLMQLAVFMVWISW